MSVVCRVHPKVDLEAWEALYRASSARSAFLSTPWVRSWLASFGDQLRPRYVEMWAEEILIGVCLVSTITRRAGLLSLSRWHVNTDGEPAQHSVVVEHNHLLSRPGYEILVGQCLAELAMKGSADELRFSGVDANELRKLLSAFSGWISEYEARDSPFVNLELVREQPGGHLACISANTRAQVRQSLEQYMKRGNVAVQVAAGAEQALDYFEEMVSLHQRHWTSKGQRGGFASELRLRFHKEYLRDAVPQGGAQLLRVSCGGETIGILYNLISDGRAMFYQSGFRYEHDNRQRPGLVTHHLVIEHYAREGFLEYDFLASGLGEGRYKRSLANDTRALYWLTFLRPSWRVRYFSAARTIRPWLEKHGLLSSSERRQSGVVG